MNIDVKNEVFMNIIVEIDLRKKNMKYSLEYGV